MKKILVFYAIGAAFSIGNAHAVMSFSMCNQITCAGNERIYPNILLNCQTETNVGCYKKTNETIGTKYRSCSTCKSGYIRTNATVTCGTKTITYQQCCKLCEEPTVETPLTWTTVEDGNGMLDYAYEVAYTQECDCDQGLVSKAIYRCAAGYYGTATNNNGSLSGCNKCPHDYNKSTGLYLYGGNSNPGSLAITSCYVTRGNDNTGSYVYEKDGSEYKCYYNSRSN